MKITLISPVWPRVSRGGGERVDVEDGEGEKVWLEQRLRERATSSLTEGGTEPSG